MLIHPYVCPIYRLLRKQYTGALIYLGLTFPFCHSCYHFISILVWWTSPSVTEYALILYNEMERGGLVVYKSISRHPFRLLNRSKTFPTSTYTGGGARHPKVVGVRTCFNTSVEEKKCRLAQRIRRDQTEMRSIITRRSPTCGFGFDLCLSVGN